MSGATVPPSPAAVVVSTYARQKGIDPKKLVTLGIQALAEQILREGEVSLPHHLVRDCSTCPIGQRQCPQTPANIIRFPQVG